MSDDNANLAIPRQGRGKPRDMGREAQIIELLSQGISVGKVASQIGIHRNTVCNVRKRIRDSRPTDVAADVAADLYREQEAIEAACRLREKAQREEREARWRMHVVRYKAAVFQLIKLIEKAADAVMKGRSVWSAVSMDKEFAGGGNMYALVGGRSDDPADSAEVNDLHEVLLEAMAGLGETQRKILELVFWDGKGPEQVSAELGVDPSQVIQIQRSALDALRERVA